MCFPPGLIILLAGILIASSPNTILNKALSIFAPIISILFIWSMPDDTSIQFNWIELNIILLELNPLGKLFGTVFSIMALLASIFGFGSKMSQLELGVGYIYAGAAISVCFVGDLITLFIFWEIMALASTFIVLSGKTNSSAFSAKRYFLIHLLGGTLLLGGIAGYWINTGTISFTVMNLNTAPEFLILAAFLINAGAPPLSSWLSDAYPESSPGGMVFLSAFTTKTAVYVILRSFAGEEILIYFGLFMIFYGIIYALLENDMRRILAYSIVNQVGFMITAAGIGTQLAVNGAAAHAFCHIFYKALLLMSAGAVLHVTHKRKCTDLGGLYKSMPLTAICGIIGALSISAFPLTSGFISKSMITDAASNEQLAVVWYLLIAASAGVFLHAGIKFPWFVFFQKNSGLKAKDPSFWMCTPMIILSIFCILIGVVPNLLYDILPYPVYYVPYTGTHIGTQFQLLLFSGLAFFIFLPQMKRTLTITLDTDWFYRKAARLLIEGFQSFSEKGMHQKEIRAHNFKKRLLVVFSEQGSWAAIKTSSVPAGVATLWILLILCLCLLIYYL